MSNPQQADAATPTFNEFPPTPYEEWRRAVDKAIKGASFEKRLITKTYEEIDLQPMYRREDIANLPHLDSLPGCAPYLRGATPPYTAKSAELLAALRDFELTYAAYADFQRGMENYWCLRWLRQQQASAVAARVLRESLVRLELLPLVLKVPSLPALDRGARVALAIERIDLLDAECRARFVDVLPAEAADETLGDAVEDDAPE